MKNEDIEKTIKLAKAEQRVADLEELILIGRGLSMPNGMLRRYIAEQVELEVELEKQRSE